MSAPAKSILLVVDDEPMIVRLIIRSFKKDFDQILYAATPSEAESILHAHPVTHFICDNNLGPTSPPDSELINRWHMMFPNIEKLVLFTGMDINDVPVENGIDVISKSSDPHMLLDYLKDNLQPMRMVN